MPYPRKYRRPTGRSVPPRKRKNYGTPAYRRTNYRPGGLANMGRGGTKKFWDTADTLTVTAAERTGADSTATLVDIDVASGANGRSNMTINLHSLYIRGDIEVGPLDLSAAAGATASAALTQGYVRIAIILDRQPNGAAIASTSIWKSDDINSPLNLDSRKRVKVLLDKTFKLPAPIGQWTHDGTNMDIYRGAVQVPKKWYLQFKKPIRVGYDDTESEGTIANTMENVVSIWFMTSHFVTTNYVPTFKYICRARFTDAI